MEIEDKYPKLIKDFIKIQRENPDAIILTEVGGFFEIWELDDLKLGHAVKASQILDIALTRRDKSKLDSPRMAGFPSYVVENYIKKLVDAGETVILVKQSVRGLKAGKNKDIERKIERRISPATSIDQQKEKSSYFASVYREGDSEFLGISLIDLSTGEVRISEMNVPEGISFLKRNNPLEILVCADIDLSEFDCIIHPIKNTISNQSSSGVVFSKIYNIENPSSNHSVVLSKLGLEFWRLGSLALANLMNFLVDYNPLLLKKISKPTVDRIDESLFLSKNAYISLDIFDNPLVSGNNTLYSSLNQNKTAMGRRTLENWLNSPSKNKEVIENRLELVQSFLDKEDFLDELKNVYDFSRMSRRMAIKTLMPHEIFNFHKSLDVSYSVFKKLDKENKRINEILKILSYNFDLGMLEIGDTKDYLFFKGDLYDKIKSNHLDWENSLKELTDRTVYLETILGAKLRVSEKSDSIHLLCAKGLSSKLKENGIPFRIKTSELQILDEKWEKLAQKEFYSKRNFHKVAEDLFLNFISDCSTRYGEELISFSKEIGELDVLSTFAKLAKERNYTRPKIVQSEKSFVDFKNMRHPVVELMRELEETFVPNCIKMNNSPSMKNTMVIYGANSAGKSTVLKSLAINIIMAQIGSFIPCDEGSSLSLFDSIMTRMTTYDSLNEGLSTFTMEMIELQSALQKRKEKSLFLFDEIGRGTSVDDGEAIAFSVLDYLRKEDTSAITLFSTHYHGLVEKIQDFSNLDIKHISTEIQGTSLIFSRKLMAGAGDGSYGLLVAKSCGIPEEIIRLAENYRNDHKKLVISRYNSSIKGTICELCEKEQAQETHHLIEQHQGKVQEIFLNGIKKAIHDKGNLLLICGTCHNKITKNKIQILKKKMIGSGGRQFYLEIKESN